MSEEPRTSGVAEQPEEGMGVSSERVGPTGPGQRATDGTRDVSPQERDPDEETLPEQAVGGPEDNPEGIEPRAGYPSKDPRSDS